MTRWGQPAFSRLVADVSLVALAVVLGACTDTPPEGAPQGGAEQASVDRGAPKAVPASTGGRIPSQAGRYRVELRPLESDVALGELHTWRLRIARSDGGDIGDATVSFDGGMPSHGHGLPTAPRLVPQHERGDYFVEGVRFHMSGAWELRVELQDESGRDLAVLPIDVAP